MKKRGLIITRFDPIVESSDAGLINLIRNSRYDFDIYDSNPVNVATWSTGLTDIQGRDNQFVTSETFAAPAPEWQENVIKFYTEHADEYDFIVTWIIEPEIGQVALGLKKRFPNLKWLAFLCNYAGLEFSGEDVSRNAGLLEVRALASSLSQVTKADNPFRVSEYTKKEYLNRLSAFRVGLSPMRLAKKYLWDKGFDIAENYCNNLKSLYHNVAEQADVTFLLPNLREGKDAIVDLDSDKVQIFTPGFDQTLKDSLSEKPETENAPLKFVCCGVLNNQTKRMQTLIQAVKLLKEHDEDLKKKIKIDFYGFIGEKDLAEIANQDVTDLFTIHSPKTPYLEKIQAIDDADWAILIDENVSRKSDQNKDYPLMMTEYLGLKKPIFAISQYSGVAANIVAETGCGLVVTHSASEIAMYLAKILYKDYDPVNYHDEALKNYDVKSSADQVDALIDKTLESNHEETTESSANEQSSDMQE